VSETTSSAKLHPSGNGSGPTRLLRLIGFALKGCGATLTFALSKSKGCELNVVKLRLVACWVVAEAGEWRPPMGSFYLGLV
jgi:hypothetical protein